MKTLLLLSITLALKLIHAEATGNTSSSVGPETTTEKRSDILSVIVGGIETPIKEAADILDYNLKVIFPGTEWCGTGNRSRSAEDLGLFKLTDYCCRQHDSCNDSIPAGESRHGLNNSGFYTRSNCECDEKFYDCLKEADTPISINIGVAYFNVLRPKCFRKEHPVLGCKKYEGLLLKRCTVYELDYTSPEVWQWFDQKEF